jgi:hypothetical protein
MATQAPQANRTAIGTVARLILRAIEPWYDWGVISMERMEGSSRERDSGYGDVRYFQLQWFGIHIGFQFGRTPKREG